MLVMKCILAVCLLFLMIGIVCEARPYDNVEWLKECLEEHKDNSGEQRACTVSIEKMSELTEII